MQVREADLEAVATDLTACLTALVNRGDMPPQVMAAWLDGHYQYTDDVVGRLQEVTALLKASLTP